MGLFDEEKEKMTNHCLFKKVHESKVVKTTAGYMTSWPKGTKALETQTLPFDSDELSAWSWHNLRKLRWVHIVILYKWKNKRV